MARARDNTLVQQMVQLIIDNGGEVLSDGQLLEELALCFGVDTDTINADLLYLRRKQVVMTDRHDGRFYGVYLLPNWQDLLAEVGIRLTTVNAQVDLTDQPPVTEENLDYPTLAQHMLEQAGLAIERSKKADEIMARHQELVAENQQLDQAVRATAAALERTQAEVGALRNEMTNLSSDSQMVQALTVGLEAAKEEVKRLRNELVVAHNENKSLENANRSLTRELRYAKQASGGPLQRRLRPETANALDEFKRGLEGQ